MAADWVGTIGRISPRAYVRIAFSPGTCTRMVSSPRHCSKVASPAFVMTPWFRKGYKSSKRFAGDNLFPVTASKADSRCSSTEGSGGLVSKPEGNGADAGTAGGSSAGCTNSLASAGGEAGSAAGERHFTRMGSALASWNRCGKACGKPLVFVGISWERVTRKRRKSEHSFRPRLCCPIFNQNYKSRNKRNYPQESSRLLIKLRWFSLSKTASFCRLGW